MTIAVVDTPVTAGQYSAPSAVPPVSLRPLGQANQRLENKDGDEVERISRSMRSAEPMVWMESPRSVSTRNPIVCECLRLERSALINAMEAGCHTVQALSMHTGAGTTCGGCLPRLAELTPETPWQTGDCLEVIDSPPRGKSFRFYGPPLHVLRHLHSGQRLIVRAAIRGVDVQRPYTPTSSVTERRYYEITVQREPHGIMSNWLFDNMGPGSAVAILPPSGTCVSELHESRPLVCLVGGIGITPALCICRSAAASGARRRVHVDYSAATRGEMVCAGQRSELASQHPSSTCHSGS